MCVLTRLWQFLKASYLKDVGQLSRDAPEVSEGDIEDAMAFQDESARPHPQQEDDVMTDGPPDEDDEMEAMITFYEEQNATAPQRPQSPAMSDPDYDDIFAELVAQEQSVQQHQPPASADRMDEDHAMSF